ncbi:MAG: ABC-2 family transporter protein [Planctomycetaceae bacterium]
MSSSRPNYLRVLSVFFRNSIVREMLFRGNFIIVVTSRALWFAAQVVLFEIIFRSLGPSGDINGWGRPEYFAFMATGMLINAVVETFFMPNCANFSELVRTGNLDYVLVKPIDTQFLISFEKVNLPMLNQVVFAGGLLGYSLWVRGEPIGLVPVLLYVLFLAVAVAFFYSLMLALASTSVWFGRNQGLYDFWFYVTVFARYPWSIYNGSSTGYVLQAVFTYVVPILLVVTVPASELLSKVEEGGWRWWFSLVALASTAAGLLVSRAIFHWSLRRYRSASS